jgi:NADH:ubiquinone oxidoreductase subunit 6 (subunit J)
MSNGFKLVLVAAEFLTMASALIVALHPNILYASVGLLFAFIGIAVMFVYAGADFIAGTQVVVYVGGVTILILFAIMLTTWMTKFKMKDLWNRLLLPAVVLALALVPFLTHVLHELGNYVEKSPIPTMEAFAATPKTSALGLALLSSYLLPFEAITILLLGALVGAVWLARPK